MYVSRFIWLFSFMFAEAFVSGASQGSSENVATLSLPFTFTYLFTTNLNLGQPAKPIAISSGVRVVEPIINGTISGPAINGTLGYSLATPSLESNGTIQKPVINAVGMTDDGFPFYIYETGIGSPSEQITRIEVEIGGGAKYATLRNGFILASVVASADRKTVKVEGYLVKNM